MLPLFASFLKFAIHCDVFPHLNSRLFLYLRSCVFNLVSSSEKGHLTSISSSPHKNEIFISTFLWFMVAI